MSKRQVDWAKRKRLELIEELGGKCAKCDSKEKLEVDHINGRNYSVRRLASNSRVIRYWREYKSGVPLRVLCSDCNKKLLPIGIFSRLGSKTTIDSPF